jgi:hypothetical protein
MDELATDPYWEDFYDKVEVPYHVQLSGTVLDQFIKDGGEPWAIYKTEVAYLGMTLEEMVQTSNWETY